MSRPMLPTAPARTTPIGSVLRRRVAATVASLALILLGGPFVAPALADPTSPLTVTDVASPSPVASGAQITYTITMVNTAGSKLTNLVLSDQLNGVGTIQNPPATPQYAVTSSQGTCAQSAQLVTCSGGTLQGGATWTVTIRGVVTAPSGSTINNTASITGTRSAQNFTTSASAQTLVQGSTGGTGQPDLTINTTGPTSVVAGASFDYTLTVNNLGTANATGVTIRDTLPAGVTLQPTPYAATSLFACSSAGTPVVVTCTGGAVTAGQNGTVTLHVIAPATAGSTLTNTAVVDPDNSIAESNELNNTSAAVNTAVTTPPATGALTVTQTDSPDPVAPGDTLTYKVVVTNIGSTRADDVTVVDGTQGLEASSIVATQVIVNGTLGTGYGCTVAAPQVTCKIRSLNPGGTLTVTVVGKVIAPAGVVLLNTATATANVKNTGVTASATQQTTVRPGVDFSVTKLGSPDPVCARSWPHADPADVCAGGLVYTITVGNSGIHGATTVLVRDVLPAGTIYDSFAGAGVSCALGAGNTLDCTIASIPAASTVTYTITLVAPPTTGPLANTVTVDPYNSIFEADETNNSATATVQVSTGVDLTVFKYDSSGPAADPAGTIPAYPAIAQGVDPIATNGTQYYTIYVDNLGTQDATNVRVEDTLPAGTTFLGATADEGFSCSYAAGKVTCVGGHLLGTESEFYGGPSGPNGPSHTQFATITIRIFATNAVQPAMHNEVRVDPLGEIAEANENNNLAVQNTKVEAAGSSENAFNQLTVVKTQADPSGAAPIATNGRTTYQLHVGNDGTDPVSTIVVKDILPAGARFVSALDAAGPSPDSFSCSHDGPATGGVVTCSGGALSGTLNSIPGVPTARDILVTFFAPNVPGTYTNVAKVDPDNLVPEGNEFDNQSQAPVVVKTAGDGGKNSVYQLTIGKTADAQVSTSSPITYTLTVSNVGTDPAFGVVVRDVLPAGTAFISAADTIPGPNQFTCSAAVGVVTCTGATLGGTDLGLSTAPQTRTITVLAFAPTQPGIYTNNAFVDPDNTIPEGDETDNHASADTKVVVGTGYIDLTVSKCDGGPCPTTGNTVYTDLVDHYTVTVSNTGTDPAFQVVVKDVLPAGAAFVSATDILGGDGAFLCGYAAGVVTCTGGTLDGSAGLVPGVPTSRDIDIAIKVPNVDDLPITNQVFVDPDNTIAEANETNNQASDTSVVHSPFDVSVDKSGPKTANQNSKEDYVITVTNSSLGGRSLTGVDMVDPLPVGLIPLGVEAEGDWQCQVTENAVNVVSCIGDLAPGASVKITVHTFITQDGGTLDNQACVDTHNAIVEFDETNNCSTKETQIVTHKPDISVHKAADTGSVTAGDALRYTITVSNIGDAPADSSSFTVKDTLPGVVSFVGVNADNGTTCSHDGSATGGVVTCNPGPMGVGATTSIAIDVTVLDTATTAFLNTAQVAGTVTPDATTDPCTSATACADEALTTNNESSVVVSAGGAAIDLVMGPIVDNPDPVAVGNLVTYTATVTNAGSQAALAADGNQVVVRFTVPTIGVVVGTPTASQGFLCTKAVGVVTCTGDLASAASTIVTIPITPQPASPLTLTVTGTVDPLGAIAESSEANNTATQTTTVSPSTCQGCMDLVMGQIIATPNPIPNGTDVTYQMVVTNIGDQAVVTANPSTDVLLAIDLDRVSNESALVSVSATGALTCQANPFWPGNHALPEIVCTAPSGFAPGQGAEVTVVAHAATAATPSFVDLDAVADPGHLVAEFNEANNAQGLRVDTVAP